MSLAHDAIASLPLASTTDDGANAVAAPFDGEIEGVVVSVVSVVEIEMIDLLELEGA